MLRKERASLSLVAQNIRQTRLAVTICYQEIIIYAYIPQIAQNGIIPIIKNELKIFVVRKQSDRYHVTEGNDLA